MTNSTSFLKFLVSCVLSKHLDPIEKVLHEHFPTRSQTLSRYLSVYLPNFDELPPPHEATCTNSSRLGLNMSRDKFRVAKTFLSQRYVASGTLASVLHLKLSPYVVMYTAMDLDAPLPDGFDMWFFWCHIGQLIQLGRTADLVDSDNDLAPLLHGPRIPPEYKTDVVEDPDGVLQLLYYFHFHSQVFYSSPFPEIKRPLSELPPIQLTVGTTERGTAGEMRIWNAGNSTVNHHWFGLKRQPSDPAFESSREAYALLDAACCWGIAWRGRTVRVKLSNQRLVWALNDFIDTSAEFPVVEVLLSLAARCGFEFMAIHSPFHVATVDKHALGLYNKFSEGSGLVLQLMDVVLSDVPFAKGNLRDLEDVVLSTYRAILVGSSARGYAGGAYTPGLLYAEMRNSGALVIVEDDVHSAWRPPRNRSAEGPMAHLSSPDWQRTLQKRLGRGTRGAPDGDNALTDCTPALSRHGTLVAMRADDPMSLRTYYVRSTPEEKTEAQRRQSRRIVQAGESMMRLRAAADETGSVGIGLPAVN